MPGDSPISDVVAVPYAVSGQPPLLALAGFVVFAATALWSGYRVFLGDAPDVYAENGPLENMQAALLVISAFLYAFSALCARKQEPLLLSFCALLCVAFFLREIDVERLDVPQLLIAVGSGPGRNTLLGLSFLALFLLAARRFGHYWQAGLAFTRSPYGIYLLVGGGLLVLGSVFEELRSINHHTFYEEIAELGAYYCVVVSASAVTGSR